MYQKYIKNKSCIGTPYSFLKLFTAEETERKNIINLYYINTYSQVYIWEIYTFFK